MYRRTCATKHTWHSLTIEYATHMWVLFQRLPYTSDAYAIQLYAMYLSPANFASIARPLYVDPSSSNYFVRSLLSYQLRSAAESELLKQMTIIDADAIYRESDKAFEALSELLGDDENFFGEKVPGLFDASVFAYTHVLLDERIDWKDGRMQEGLRRCQNLVAHREKILKAYFQ